MKIDYTRTPNTQDIDFLTHKINEETPDFGEAYPFAFFIRDEKGEILAGCNGSVVYGAIYTDQLWVHPQYRKQGLARGLMEKVHAYGREIGCQMATVTTMSFQKAQTFYENMGYEVEFNRTGYAKGSSLISLKKVL